MLCQKNSGKFLLLVFFTFSLGVIYRRELVPTDGEGGTPPPHITRNLNYMMSYSAYVQQKPLKLGLAPSALAIQTL